MGFLNQLFKGQTKPQSLCVDTDTQTICAPVSGKVVPLDTLSDPVFSQGMLGTGAAIKPSQDVVFCPVTGRVAAEVKTKHALLIAAENGAEVLVHVGVDSVCLRGRGFTQYVHKDDTVHAGDPLLTYNRKLLEDNGVDDTVIVTVTNPEAFSRVAPVDDDAVCAGDALLKVC